MAKKHFMLDIETLATTPDAVVTEIALVEFDISNGNIIREFHELLPVPMQKYSGRCIDFNTLAWRINNTDPVQLTKALTLDRDIRVIESFFRDFVTEFSGAEDRIVWCKGGGFGFPIINSLFPDFGKLFLFQNQYCCRALLAGSKNIDLPTPPVAYIKHNALHDAIFQAGCLSHVCNKLNLTF